MVIHRNTRLTPFQRQQIYTSYHEDKNKNSDLAEEYHVSPPTIYTVLRNGRHQDFTIHKSINKRLRCLHCGIKRLATVEAQHEATRKSQAKRYHKDYPGQMLHGDTTRLPLHAEQKRTEPRGYTCLSPLMIFAGSWMQPYCRITPSTLPENFCTRCVMNVPILLSTPIPITGKSTRVIPDSMRLCCWVPSTTSSSASPGCATPEPPARPSGSSIPLWSSGTRKPALTPRRIETRNSSGS